MRPSQKSTSQRLRSSRPRKVFPMGNIQNRPCILGIIAAASALAALGCSFNAPPATNMAVLAPEWVIQGSGAFGRNGRRVFSGVGVASGIRNEALLRQSADDRARLAIAKTLAVYVAMLSKDYMATAGGMSGSLEEQGVETALLTVTQTTLHGATITDRWLDPTDGSMYALCRLDLRTVKQALNDGRALDTQLRDYVRGNADRMHAEFNRLENR